MPRPFATAPAAARGHSTAIYFLLEQDNVSAWHRVKDAAEVWHFYAGAPLALSMCEEDGAVIEQVLGTDLAAGERPQIVVPAGWWQIGAQPRRLDAGRLHRRAGLRFRRLRDWPNRAGSRQRNPSPAGNPA